MKDYRAALFQEVCDYLPRRGSLRILEIGPKDGQDTWRLLTLKPSHLTLIELPERQESSLPWLRAMRLEGHTIDYRSADIMDCLLQEYDLIWCTGVLYHVKEQLPLIQKLYDALSPRGVLVLESATIRNPFLRWFNCVQILWPFSLRVKSWYHLSARVTHLPSKKTIKAWLEMAGFQNIQQSTCHARVSWRLAMNRVAYLGIK